MDKEKKRFFNMCRSLISTLFIIYLVFAFLIGVKMSPNDDMIPSIKAGDILIYYRINKMPSSQDVIVLEKNDTEYVGRVIARPGDEVNIVKENLIINGNTVVEESIYGSTPTYEGFMEYPVKLNSDEYFVLSDKREGGEDSRYYGIVQKSDIKGIVIGQYRRSRI